MITQSEWQCLQCGLTWYANAEDAPTCPTCGTTNPDVVVKTGETRKVEEPEAVVDPDPMHDLSAWDTMLHEAYERFLPPEPPTASSPRG